MTCTPGRPRTRLDKYEPEWPSGPVRILSPFAKRALTLFNTGLNTIEIADWLCRETNRPGAITEANAYNALHQAQFGAYMGIEGYKFKVEA